MEVSGSHNIGRLMPGSDSPVDNEARLYAEQPEYALLFSWHIAEEIIPNLTKKGFSRFLTFIFQHGPLILSNEPHERFVLKGR